MIGKIYISGLIGTYGDEVGVELIDVISQVRKQPDATSFEVYINSEGGVVETGFDIYNYLKSMGLPITTIGNGMVASIATVVFMAGQKRLITPNTQFMIHLPMGGIDFATADEMEMYTKDLKNTEGRMISFYSDELNLGKEAISPLLKNETWLTETQLQDLGFLTTNTEMKIAARAIISKTKTNNKMSKKSRLQTILNAIFKEEIAKVIFSADNKELTFPDVADDGVIEVGAKATYDGKPADGEITGADGKVYVFAVGVLTEIKDPADDPASDPALDEVTTDELVDALAHTLEYTAELSERVDALATDVTGIKKERDEAVDKLATATAMIAKLKGSSKEPETDKKDKDNKKETVSSIVAQWKKNKQTKKH